MTHITHPYGQRIGIIRKWKSGWFFKNKTKYRNALRDDFLLRNYLLKRLEGVMVNDITINRGKKELTITIFTSRPGLVIGRSGEGITKLTSDINSFAKKKSIELKDSPLRLSVEEIKFPETHANLVTEMIVDALKKRTPYRRVIKQMLEKSIASRDIKGARILVAGRLGGAEIARSEQVKSGRIPLQTLKADIDYSSGKAILPYGTIGIKVWLYKGLVENK